MRAHKQIEKLIDCGVTQQEIADAAGLRQSEISMIAAGKRKQLQANTIAAIDAAFVALKPRMRAYRRIVRRIARNA